MGKDSDNSLIFCIFALTINNVDSNTYHYGSNCYIYTDI